jgi:hypothetical protein
MKKSDSDPSVHLQHDEDNDDPGRPLIKKVLLIDSLNIGQGRIGNDTLLFNLMIAIKEVKVVKCYSLKKLLGLVVS